MHRFARILRRALVPPAVRSPCILTRLGAGPVLPNLFGVRWNTTVYDENIMNFSDRIAQRLRVILASRKNRGHIRALKLNKRTFRRLLVAFTNEDHMKTLPPEILQEVLALAIPDSSRQLMDKVLDCFKNFVETVDVRTLSMDPTIHPDQDLLRELADMRLPHEWYGLARRMKRKLVKYSVYVPYVLVLLNICLHRLCTVDRRIVAKLTVPYNISAIPSREFTAVCNRISDVHAQPFTWLI